MPPQSQNPLALTPQPHSQAFLMTLTFLLIISGAFATLHFLNPPPELLEEYFANVRKNKTMHSGQISTSTPASDKMK